MTEIGRERSTWVAMTPDVACIIDNLGLSVGTVVYSQAWTPATGYDLVDIENKLKSGEYDGIVCGLGDGNTEIGEFAAQLSENGDAPLCFVRHFDDSSSESLTAQAAYNMAAIAAAAASVRTSRGAGKVPVSGHFVWAIIVFGLLIALVMQNRKMYYVAGVHQPEPKRKKKK